MSDRNEAADIVAMLNEETEFEEQIADKHEQTNSTTEEEEKDEESIHKFSLH